jgi:hypothetical protein
MIISARRRGPRATGPTGLPGRHAARRLWTARHLAVLAAVLAAAATAAGCGAVSSTGAAGSQPSAAPTITLGASGAPASPAAASGYTGPHFATPQAAMTYLATAYNNYDITALHHVTQPQAFNRLMTMRATAVNLRLAYCALNPHGDYTCHFTHDFPASEHKHGHGQAVFIAAPALNPGWYMYQFQSCD